MVSRLDKERFIKGPRRVREKPRMGRPLVYSTARQRVTIMMEFDLYQSAKAYADLSDMTFTSWIALAVKNQIVLDERGQK